VMHQPVDHGGGQRVIDVERLAPVPEFTIRRDEDRSGFVTGSDDLEHQVCTAFVDGKISQLIEEEKVRTYILSKLPFERWKILVLRHFENKSRRKKARRTLGIRAEENEE